MQANEVTEALKAVAVTRRAWLDAKAEFDKNIEKVMKRLCFEAVINGLTQREVAKAVGMETSQIKARMRKYNLGTRHENRRQMSDSAAKALRENAELMGVDIREMDLLSPLAYLPMGSQMRSALNAQRTEGVSGNDLDLGERPADCGCCTIVDSVSLAALKAAAAKNGAAL